METAIGSRCVVRDPVQWPAGSARFSVRRSSTIRTVSTASMKKGLPRRLAGLSQGSALLGGTAGVVVGTGAVVAPRHGGPGAARRVGVDAPGRRRRRRSGGARAGPLSSSRRWRSSGASSSEAPPQTDKHVGLGICWRQVGLRPLLPLRREAAFSSRTRRRWP